MLTIKDIQKAKKNIKGLVKKTPIKKFSDDIFLKLENQQPVVNGFKIRGAANLLISTKPKEVLAAALGTHGFAVGYIGKKLGVKTACAMPKGCPENAVNKMKKLVDEVIVLGDTFDETEINAQKIAKIKKIPFVHPYNDELVIAGQGTIGLEIAEQLPEVKNIYVPVSGGGLISGICIVIKSLKPNVRIIGVQPSSIHLHQTTIAGGDIVPVKKETLAEKLIVHLSPKSKTYPYIKKYVDDFILVEEKDIRKAIKDIYKKTGEVAEGSGAITLAAALKDKKRKGLSVCVISGGNIDPKVFKEIIR